MFWEKGQDPQKVISFDHFVQENAPYSWFHSSSGGKLGEEARKNHVKVHLKIQRSGFGLLYFIGLLNSEIV